MTIITLKDLKDNDEKDGKKEKYFTGGKNTGTLMEGDDEKKQIIQNAPEPAQRLLQKAMESQANPEFNDHEGSPTEAQPSQKYFQGSAQTLKGKQVKTASSSKPKEESREQEVERTIVLYNNGFVIMGEGMQERFMDYADQDNVKLLEQITEGRVPLREMNVKPYQRVSLKIDYKHGENYENHSEPREQFVGSCKKISSSGETTRPGNREEIQKTCEILPDFIYDATQPSTVIQLRLKNGKVVKIKVNLTSTLREIIAYVSLCTRLPSNEIVLLSAAVPQLDSKENIEKTVSELNIQNSVLIQK